MVSLNDFGDLFVEIRTQWNDAEKVIKLAEQVDDTVVIPAVNELRYAGRRLIDALESASTGSHETVSLFTEAKFYCLRARHDAIDAALSAIHEKIGLAAHKLGYRAVLQAYPGYPDLLSKLARARSLIAESRAARDNREAIYRMIESVEFEPILRHFEDFRANEAVMKGLARRSRWEIILLVAGAVGGVGTVIGLFY